MNEGTEGARGDLEFVYERNEGSFAVLRDPDGREVYLSRVRLPPDTAPGSRIRVPRDERGEADWRAMRVEAGAE